MHPVLEDAEDHAVLTWDTPSGQSWVRVEKEERLRVTISFAPAHSRVGALLDQIMQIARCSEKAIVSGMSDDFVLAWGPMTNPANPEPAVMHFALADDDRLEVTWDFDVVRAKGQTWETVLATYAEMSLE